MNIENDPELIHLELKYRERCGGLWLRLYGTQDVYCAPCRAAATNLPAHRGKATKPRLPGEQRFDLKRKGKHALRRPEGVHDGIPKPWFSK